MSDAEQKISQLQMFEQGMQQILQQKQQFQSQLVETSSALEELGKSGDAYTMIGNIMVKAEKPELEKELKKKKDMLDIRMKTLERQEAQLREKANKLQEEVVKNMKGKKE